MGAEQKKTWRLWRRGLAHSQEAITEEARVATSQLEHVYENQLQEAMIRLEKEFGKTLSGELASFTKRLEENLTAETDKVKQELVGRDEVTGVEYISREKALESFREINKDNDVIKKSLDVLEENPLEASLNIKVANASQYAGIVSFLESGSVSGLIY